MHRNPNKKARVMVSKVVSEISTLNGAFTTVVFEAQHLAIGSVRFSALASHAALWHAHYRFPFARLWVAQSIWQFLAELPPPLLHAATWSASISSRLYI